MCLHINTTNSINSLLLPERFYLVFNVIGRLTTLLFDEVLVHLALNNSIFTAVSNGCFSYIHYVMAGHCSAITSTTACLPCAWPPLALPFASQSQPARRPPKLPGGCALPLLNVSASPLAFCVVLSGSFGKTRGILEVPGRDGRKGGKGKGKREERPSRWHQPFLREMVSHCVALYSMNALLGYVQSSYLTWPKHGFQVGYFFINKTNT